jgi:hypothetical protein
MTDLIESEDELLDPQPGPAAAAPHRLAATLRRLRDRTPLGSDTAVRTADPGRRRRTALALLLAATLAAGAGAAGVVVHSHDLARAQARTQDRLLLHLLGGSATLTFNNAGGTDGGTTSGSFSTPLPSDFTVALRNDGAQPLEVTGVRLAVPGVDSVRAAPDTIIPPGESAALTTRVNVHCTAQDLPRYPSGVTVTVRTPPAKGRAAGSATTLPLTFDVGHPGDDSTASAADRLGLALGQPYYAGSFATDSFYRLCGNVLRLMPPLVTTAALPGNPSPQNPVIRYTLHVAASSDTSQTAVPLTQPIEVPGVSGQSDLTAARQIGPDGLDVTVTDRITDCSAFGSYLSVRGGATQAAHALDAAVPVGLEPADPRFQTSPVPLSTMTGPVYIGVGTENADLQSALLDQLSAACPDL